MPVRTLLAMFATVAASFAAPTIVQAAQEKPDVQTATPKPIKSGHAAVNDAGWQREHMSQNRPAILPNITHYEMGLAPQLVDAALPFLDAKAARRAGGESIFRRSLAGTQRSRRNPFDSPI
jgi:hypothetical protein